VKPVRITAPHRVAQVVAPGKYVKKLKGMMGSSIDYAQGARARISRASPSSSRRRRAITVIGEATTSWSFVGAGLAAVGRAPRPRVLDASGTRSIAGLQLFFSREVTGRAGEDLVEKQNAEQGVMPVVPEEYIAYGYTDEDRHFVRAFLGKEKPMLTFDDGVEVVKRAHDGVRRAPSSGRTLAYPRRGIDKFVPAVAKGTWKP
jgi:predicted dehydrogenase